jgi:hypothetical protein
MAEYQNVAQPNLTGAIRIRERPANSGRPGLLALLALLAGTGG